MQVHSSPSLAHPILLIGSPRSPGIKKGVLVGDGVRTYRIVHLQELGWLGTLGLECSLSCPCCVALKEVLLLCILGHIHTSLLLTWLWKLTVFCSPVCPGIDDDDVPTEEPETAAAPEEIPPLEGEDDASRMEEVD